MLISEYNSKKLKSLSFFLIVMVLYIHSYYLEGELFPLSLFVQVFIDKGLCSVAVPMLFSISGLLFFRGIYHIKDIYNKQIRRIKTVLIPYVLWNVLFVLWFIVLDMIPPAAQYINSNIIADLFSSSIWRGLFYLFIKPAGFHLWFLRDLILIILISPVLYVSIKYTRWFFPVICLVIGIKIGFFNWLAFFSAGGIISLYHSLEQFDDVAQKLGVISILTWVLFSILLSCYHFLIRGIVVAELGGIVSLWFLYDKFKQSRIVNCIENYNIYNYSFFIYVFHEPFFNIIKKIGLRICGTTSLSITLLYLVNPIIAIVLIVLIARIISAFMPKIYKVLTGGR